MTMTSAGISGGWFPGTPTTRREVCSARLEDRDRIAEQSGCLLGGGGEPVQAFLPRAEFHSLFEVDGPDDDILAGGQVRHEHVKPAALARPCRAGEQRMPTEEEHSAGRGILEWP